LTYGNSKPKLLGLIGNWSVGEDQHIARAILAWLVMKALNVERLGDTESAARTVYQQGVFAKHWFSLMRNALCAEDFWRAAVLFLEVTGGRFEHIRFKEAVTSIYRSHWPSIDRGLENRFEKILDKRKKQLFGGNAPSPIFFQRNGSIASAP